MIQYKKQHESNEIILNSNEDCCSQKQSVIYSEHIQKYEKILQNFDIATDLSLFEKALSSQKISYAKEKCNQPLNIVMLNSSKNSSIVSLAVSFSCFIFEITLLNLDKQSSTSNLNILDKGAFGKIYSCSMPEDSKQFVIKAIYYKNKCNKNDKIFPQLVKKLISESIRQYCFYKLFSALKIGPCVSELLGFDILIYDDAIEFAMQKCNKNIRIESLREDLYTSLKLMHSYNIIHGDIKPQNIMWSPKQNKNVYIDFGLSLNIKQQVSQKTFTHYFGTYDYVSQEMKQILMNSRMDYVDVYYNDLYGLQFAIENLMSQKNLNICHNSHRNRSLHQINEQLSNDKRQYINFILNNQMVRLIYNKNMTTLQQFLLKSTKFYMTEQTIEILQELQLNFYLKKIRTLLLRKFMTTQEQIKKIFKNSHEFEEIKYRKMKFQNRILEISSKEYRSLNFLMQYLLIFYFEDATPSAVFQKQKLKKQLQIGNPQQSSYWKNLVLYSKNLYLTNQQLTDAFQTIREKLQLGKWNSSISTAFNIFTKAEQIAEEVYKKFNINLFKIYEDLSMQKQLKICEQNKKNEIFKKLRLFFDELQLYSKNYGRCNLNLKTERRLRAQFQQKHNLQNNSKVQNLLDLFEKNNSVLSLTDDQDSISRADLFDQFFEAFAHFQPANNIYGFLEGKYLKLYLQQNTVKSYFENIIKFYQKQFTVCFTQYFYVQFNTVLILYELYCSIESKQQIILDRYKQKILKLIVKVNQFFPNDVLTQIKVYEKFVSILAVYANYFNDYSAQFYELIYSYMCGICSKFTNHKIIKISSFQLAKYEIQVYSYFYNTMQLLSTNFKKNDKFEEKVLLPIQRIQKFKYRHKNIIIVKFQIIKVLYNYEVIDSNTRYSKLTKLIDSDIQQLKQFYCQNDYIAHIYNFCQLTFEKGSVPPSFIKESIVVWIQKKQKHNYINIFLYPEVGIMLSFFKQLQKQSKLEQYLTLFLLLVRQTVTEVKTQLNFYQYFFLKQFMMHLLKNKYTDQVKNTVEMMFRKLITKDCTYFMTNYVNFIVIIQVLLLICFNKVAQQKYERYINFYEHYKSLITLAQIFLTHVNYYIARQLRIKLKYWYCQLCKLKILKLPERKRKIMYLNNIRSPHYQLQKNIYSHYTQIFENDKLNQEISRRLSTNYNLMISNKMVKIQQIDIYNLTEKYKTWYLLYLNAQTPNLQYLFIPSNFKIKWYVD